ncbi:hypothetical protein [Roseateles depolymerans]|uniref:Uncharacterized protein n=1 Tax=Roseateles depolymerans TaxID=76731 RepID=A0A0U3MXG0_9BURK|nr:hypothetical protein [Roseateles depolymerans]ALV07715.1 hypothetical protein RD2015_3257 [Roseateles depolymerans]REG22061.1 hypothetical protein DES44_1203 [Roseateles depolymerans]
MTHETMVRIPSFLKGLVETRARADAYVQRLETIKAEVEQRLAKAGSEREACDKLIRAYNPNLNPTAIEPVRAWRHRYGPRGARNEAIKAFLQAAYPESVSTVEVAWHLTLKFELDFHSPEVREAWKKTSVRNPLRVMAQRGEVERLEVEALDGHEPARWRWVPSR